MNEIERHRERTQTLWHNFEGKLIEFKMANFHADQMLTKIVNQTANNAVFYAAELTRRVECMEKVDEQQKRETEMLRKTGNVFIVVPFKSANAFPAYPAGVDSLRQFLANMDRHEQNKEEPKNQARILELENQNREQAERLAKNNDDANVFMGQAHRKIGELEQEKIESAKLVQKLGDEKESQKLVIEQLGSEMTEMSKEVEAQNQKIEELEAANSKLQQADNEKQQKLNEAQQMKINEESEKMHMIEADLQNQMKLSANQKTSIEARDLQIGELKSQFAEKSKKMENEIQNAQRQLIAMQEALDSSERNAMDLKADIDQLMESHKTKILGFQNRILVLRQEATDQRNNNANMKSANDEATRKMIGKLREVQINNIALRKSLLETTGKYNLLPGVVAEQKQDLEAANGEVNNLKEECKTVKESDAQAKRELQLQTEKVDELKKQQKELEASRDELRRKMDAFNSAKEAFDLAKTQVNAAGTSDLQKGRKRRNVGNKKAAPAKKGRKQ
ncbi:hypothetical protein B9Z55_027934 [Caenorhabditis nigoni]|uniref:Uncharacterized protein n=1 Tax=Caenorhabditis nigoni TaxID=1611254 RepID=A0A2G5SD74_9PELO|nr:hypothetical protein B9Z55_027934 [Caenorhabditis nigoni]